jgi:hypothetical protein
VAHEEYDSGTNDDDDSEDEENGEMAAIAIVSTPPTSLFNSQNENAINTNHKCLMAKATEDVASGGEKWIIHSGATSHMTRSKKYCGRSKANTSNVTVSYGDKSSSKLLGFGKVVITPDVSLVNVMLVETIGYDLLSVRQLATMGYATYFDVDIVVVMWSKTLKVAFVGYVENGLYVVDFSKKPTTAVICLIAKANVGWLWHRRLAHVNMRALQNLYTGGHILGLKDISFAKDRVCRACIEGKMHETSHPKQDYYLFQEVLGPPSHGTIWTSHLCKSWWQ